MGASGIRPEAQAIRELISSRQVTTLITNHTFSNLVLRPVGVKPTTIHPDGHPVGFAPDECFATAEGDRGAQWLGERMAAQVGYSNQFGWELYDTTGTTEDYSYNATGGYGYTFEIGPRKFHPPYEEVVAEYVGTTDAAEGVTKANASELTTAAAADCGGQIDHDVVGGGLGEAYLIAFENAVNATTHSLITGTAPDGATLTLERSGVFPLWDGTLLGDTVATSLVADGGAFEWHTNPSTRPFVQSRMANVLSDPKDSLQTSGVAEPFGPAVDTPFEVTEPADVLRAAVRTTVPVDGQVVVYRQFTLELIDPNGIVVATADEFGPVNSIAWTGPDGAGVPAGTYTLRVTNALGFTLRYNLEASTHDVISDHTPRQFESWTLTCLTEQGGIAEQQAVFVERGDQVDVGAACDGVTDGPGAGVAGNGPPFDPPPDGPPPSASAR